MSKIIINIETEGKEPLYIQLYEYYKDIILSGKLKPGDRLPSIRKCSAERMISRTTVEGAYLQLAAEGYIISRPGSGFYVSQLNYKEYHSIVTREYNSIKKEKSIKYDFTSSKIDYKSFNFDLWSRYIKSALRNGQRLLSYGDTQGEYDLRASIAKYVGDRRGVICNPEQIIVGAGIQSLLHILCSLIGEKSKVVFAGDSFTQGKAIFEDRGFDTITLGTINNALSYIENENIKIIYTYPSHTTPWGEVMSMQTRLSLLSLARKNNCLIVEDDYDSEFRYYGRPVPSLQGLDGGQNVVYMGTFSKLLLPSLRISFMVLPMQLMGNYNEIGHVYNQTASKTEQIALCQFIRDGHLERQIKKARKLYMSKSQYLCNVVNKVFEDKAVAISGSGGVLIQVEVKCNLSSQELVKRAEDIGILIKPLESIENKYPRVLLSCSGVCEEEFNEALELLKKVWL